MARNSETQLTPSSHFEPDNRSATGRLKIVHIIEQLGVGGAEKQLLGLLTRLDPQRYENTVIYFVQCPDSLDQRFRELGCSTLRVNKAGVSRLRFILDLRRAICSFSPQIVHTWLYTANFWGRWAAASCGVRHIIASDRMEHSPSSRLVRLYERMLAGRTLRLANSRAVAASLNREYGLDLDRIQVIYNGVKLDAVNREQARDEIRRDLGLSVDHKLVIMLGRQAVEKNYPMFFRAGKRVCDKRDDVTFLAIGRQDQKAEMDGLLTKLGAGDRVRCIDGQWDVARWLAAADVFCFTSNSEGCPNAVLEAMLSGLPIVCTAFASACELLADGCGMLVPLDDDGAMATQVERLLDNGELRNQLGATAQTRARRCFTWEATVSGMEAVYTSMVAGAADSTPNS